MTLRALAALALGGSLLVLLPGGFQTLDAGQSRTVSPEIIERYRQTLATDQDDLTLHYLLGVALLQDNQNASALTELQTAYPAYQQSIEAHYNLAIAALRLDDLISAEIYLEQAEVLGATDTPELYPLAGLYFNLALESQESGNANEAIRYFHKALSLDPQRDEVFRQLGDLYAQRNDTELAIQSFRKYLQRFPSDPVSRDYLFTLEFNRALDLLAADDLINAATGFATAIEIQPQSPLALYYLGYIAYAQEQYGQAEELLRRAFPMAEESVRQTIRPLLYNIALSLRKSGKLAEALAAVSLLADQEQATFNEVFLAGTVNLDLLKYRVAQTYLQQAVALNSNDQGARQNLLAAELGAFNEWLSEAMLKLQAEDFPGADVALRQAESLQPQNDAVTSFRERVTRARQAKAADFFSRARGSIDAGDLKTAAELVRCGLDIQPDHKDGVVLRQQVNTALAAELNALLEKAAQLRMSGAYDEATNAYEQVLAIAPQQAEALSGLAQVTSSLHRQSLVLLQQGQKALDAGEAAPAAEAYRQALALDPDLEQAREGLNAAQEMKANRLDEYLHNGRLALSRNRYDEARKWFHQAISIDESPRAQEQLTRLDQMVSQKADDLTRQAEQAVRTGAYPQAQKLFMRALKLVPEHKPAKFGQDELSSRVDASIENHLRQAASALGQNDYSAAMNGYRAILEMVPDHGDALDGLKKSRDLQSGNLDRLVQQGQEALSAGDWAEAERHLSGALQQDPYHKDAQKLRQRLEEVRQSGAQPGDEQKVYLQGIAYYTQGHYAQAIKSWETVLLLNPEHQKAIQNIKKTKHKLRQIEEYRDN